MKKYYNVFIIAIIIILIGLIGWIVLFKKAGAGDECKAEKDCYSGLKCISNKCSDGKEGSSCNTYKDCKTDLLCKNSICAAKPQTPAYAEYFNKIELQKIKNGIAPSSTNIPVASTEFKTTDGMNVDMEMKDDVKGEVYFKIVDAVSGEIVFAHPKFQASGSMGRGFSAPQAAGKYDLNIYFEGKLIHTISFEVVSE